MPRTVNQNIPNPDDATQGVADSTVAIQIRRQSPGDPIILRVDYPADPDGALEFRVTDLAPADRVKVRDAALVILAYYKTQRGYV